MALSKKVRGTSSAILNREDVINMPKSARVSPTEADTRPQMRVIRLPSNVMHNTIK